MDPQRVKTFNAYIFVLEEYKTTHYLRIDASEGPIFIKMLPRKILEYSYDCESWHRIPQFTEEYNYFEDLLMVHGGNFVKREEITQKFHRNNLEIIQHS